MNIKIIILKILRKIYKVLIGFKSSENNLHFDFEGQDAANLIKTRLSDNKPIMVSRFGNTELRTLVKYYWQNFDKKKYINYITGRIGPFWWSNNENIDNTGFFPSEIDSLKKFSKLMLDDIKYIDILGSWSLNEKIVSEYLSSAIKIPFRDLEPYYHSEPWSSALEAKKVLVIHPFAKSIEKQYKKRESLFKNQLILPKFTLKTIKAVQSIGGNYPSEFSTWFEALDYMKNQIDNTDFDIAIIGCGAYGLHLAAHVKRIGKKSIHLGGQTQVLFGIRGSRWEDRKFFLNLFNEYWVRPLPEETPKGYKNIENGCYW